MALMKLGRDRMHSAEPLVADPSSFELEIGIENMKSYKSSRIDQIREKLIQVKGKR
jgi:hypothetical protein